MWSDICVTYSRVDRGRFRKEYGAEDEETHEETCESDHYGRFRMKKERNGLAGFRSRQEDRELPAKAGQRNDRRALGIGQHTCSCKNVEVVL